MLQRLLVHDLAIIDQLDQTFGPGFVVFTGETGAGKSIIIDALGLVLGGRADPTLVRAGAEAARVEATFTLAGPTQTAITMILARESLDVEGDVLVLAREVRREGRSTARVNGRMVSAPVLRELAELLVDVHGQGEHLSLLRPREHVYMLDRFGGLEGEREKLAGLVRGIHGLRQELRTLRQNERERERRLDMLDFQIQEIGAARLKPGEEAGLLQERARLGNAEKLTAQADDAIQALVGDDESDGAADLLGKAARSLAALARIDGSLTEPQATAANLAEQARDLSATLSHYRERLAHNPKRLNAIEERLETLSRLQRKYGERIEDVLAFAERAQAERDGLANASDRIAELVERETVTLTEISRLGEQLAGRRKQAARKLSAGIERELADLKMERGRFSVSQERQPADDGVPTEAGRVAFDLTGLDRIEFLIAPNPGEGLKPLAKIASGGEAARLMLALKGVLAQADPTPTLVFDEIDQGIGGRVGAVVGRKLWAIAAGGGHQVLCITHLPQLAGYADQHFKVEKLITSGRTSTQVRSLSTEERAAEIAQMLGGTGEKIRASAEELLVEIAADRAQAGEGGRTTGSTGKRVRA
ncbi:MAG: DNA repair protein RecN [Anaerolineales bacterium]|nr:DNA repair protein RecN [Anaerolineales bacterium]